MLIDPLRKLTEVETIACVLLYLAFSPNEIPFILSNCFWSGTKDLSLASVDHSLGSRKKVSVKRWEAL